MTQKEIVLSGKGVFGGVKAGKLLTLFEKNGACLADLKVEKGAVVFTDVTGPDVVYKIISQDISGIIFFKGNQSSHAILLCKELGISTVIAEKHPTAEDGELVTIDGVGGKLFRGDHAPKTEEKLPTVEEQPHTETAIYGVAGLLKSMLKIEPVCDGIVPLRAKFLFISLGAHPLKIIGTHGREALVKHISHTLIEGAKAYGNKPICYRTLDMPTNEMRCLDGGENEPVELNPMIGWRGIRRGIDQPELLEAEYMGVKEAVDKGAKNIWVMYPMINDAKEYKKALDMMRAVGLKPHEDVKVGIMVEVPAAAVTVKDFAKLGCDFIQIGPHDLTQFTMALDRSNPLVAASFNEESNAVKRLIEIAVKDAIKCDVLPSICAENFSFEMLEFCHKIGIKAMNSSVPLVPTLRANIAKIEAKK
ncbi:MAG: putative PEP-binding protein [Candidatus Altiarchaeota archaeon]